MPVCKTAAKSREKKRAGRFTSRPFFCARYFYAVLFLLLFGVSSLLPVSAANSSIPAPGDEVTNLIDAGIWHLALRVLEQQQQAITTDPTRWVAQEKQRIQIYQATADWPALITRLQNLPTIVPLAFYIQAQTELAAALIKTNQGQEALTILRDLIWTQARDPEVADARLRNWRRMIIDAYRISGQKQDAYRAAARLQRDYAQQDSADLIRHAKILLELGRAEEAMDRLAAQTEEQDVAVLHSLAQLRSGARSACKVMQSGLRQLRNQSVDAAVKTAFWALVAEAAQGCDDLATRTNALEHVLGAEENNQVEKSLFNIDADALWRAYLDFAIAIGNQSRFLIGADAQWQQAAQKSAKKQPVRSRALYALLMFKGQDAASREAAAKQFTRSMDKRQQGKQLLQQLFLHSTRFAGHEDIPAAARYRLVDIALAEANIALASTLMETVKKPPPGADQFFWYLRRARILILGGKGEQGAKALEEMLRETQDFEPAQRDRLLQVIFDLQSVDLHTQAISLLKQLMTRSDDVKLKREIYYWMAESKKAQQEYVAAAQLYMKSAMFPEPKAMGPWAQTARYQAAVALGQAGLFDDARAIYRHLLRVTKDATRKAVLQRELQKLRFKK